VERGREIIVTFVADDRKAGKVVGRYGQQTRPYGDRGYVSDRERIGHADHSSAVVEGTAAGEVVTILDGDYLDSGVFRAAARCSAPGS
jgi:hypothetical protein